MVIEVAGWCEQEDRGSPRLCTFAWVQLLTASTTMLGCAKAKSTSPRNCDLGLVRAEHSREPYQTITKSRAFCLIPQRPPHKVPRGRWDHKSIESYRVLGREAISVTSLNTYWFIDAADTECVYSRRFRWFPCAIYSRVTVVGFLACQERNLQEASAAPRAERSAAYSESMYNSGVLCTCQYRAVYQTQRASRREARPSHGLPLSIFKSSKGRNRPSSPTIDRPPSAPHFPMANPPTQRILVTGGHGFIVRYSSSELHRLY